MGSVPYRGTSRFPLFSAHQQNKTRPEGITGAGNDEEGGGVIDQQTCPRCGGCGRERTPDAWGHYGDCNADAGEARKPIIRLCPSCQGVGVLECDAETTDKATKAMMALLNVLTGNRSKVASKELELTAWCLLSVFGLTEHSQTEIGHITGYTRANVCKKVNALALAIGEAVKNGKSAAARKTYSLRQIIVAQRRKKIAMTELQKQTEHLWTLNHD